MLKRIENYLRSSVGQAKLAGLTMMVEHYSLAQQLDTEAIVKSYIQGPGQPQEVVLSVHYCMFD